MTEIQILKTGTTTVGIVCKDGVIMAAEKKSTMGYLIASKESEKVYEVDDTIGLTIAGAAGDAQALVRYVRAELKLFKIQNQRPLTVRGAATLLSNILQGGRWSYAPYMVQLILGGVDAKGGVIYPMDALGAYDEEKKFFSTGSGSPYALGVLEDNYKQNITTDEGAKLAVRAIKAAIERDIGSGGKGIDIMIIKSDGISKIREDLGN
ncbi:MAG: archaeal proteasome endopeptidase complex subunit beta [Candidatus Aenigmarchaeota archaeon]|nr:archaeal proteasome endopeptidase complex subunit beta [Candidatus Aenigmarchaeota archaeon]